MVCKSAPDVAYAVEFAHAWCARGGVHNVSIELPQWYLDTPGGAYYLCAHIPQELTTETRSPQVPSVRSPHHLPPASVRWWPPPSCSS